MNKVQIRKRLFDDAIKVLEGDGWKVERIPRAGKGSLRRITKGSISKKISIRTTQDTWIAFGRNATDDGWSTLEDVDYVIASSVDNPEKPQLIQIHMIDANEMRERFDRAYDARKKLGHKIKPGQGFWVSLYEEDKSDPVYNVGAGAGITNPPIASIPLDQAAEVESFSPLEELKNNIHEEVDEPPLTIAEAKRRLALSLGVDISEIKITVSS